MITEFSETYPTVKIILAAAELSEENSIEHSALTNQFEVIYIHSFGQNKMRELLNKWFSMKGSDLDDKCRQVSKLLQGLNIPRTPFIVSVLAWVLEQQGRVKHINHSAVIELLIDGLLNKFKESKSLHEHDSHSKKHFLIELAAHFDDIGIEFIGLNDFECFVTNYFKGKGINTKNHEFYDEFFSKGLLYQFNDSVSFKFDCFRSFFLANKFSKEHSLWDKALSPEKVAHYMTEFDYLSGIDRENESLLTSAQTLCDTLFLMTDIELPDKDYISNNFIGFNSTEMKSISTSINEESIKNIETSESPSINHVEARRKPILNADTNKHRFIAALRVFSVTLRNSELINNVELKMQMLEKSLSYWSELMLHELGAIQDFEKEHSDTQNELPESSKKLVVMMVNTVIPLMYSILATNCLASSKLNSFLENIITSTQKDDVYIKLFACCVLIENRHQDVAKYIDITRKIGKSNKLVDHLLFFSLLNAYFQEIKNGYSSKKLKDCLSKSFETIENSPSREKHRRKEQFLFNLEKKARLTR